jgi:hypothetical protein
MTSTPYERRARASGVAEPRPHSARDHGVRRAGWPGRHWGVVLAVAALALLPVAVLLLRSVPVGGPNSGHDADFAIHMQRLYAQELLSGHHFPVRWLTGGNDGFGSPAFYFYPQLGFLLSTAWQVLFGLNPDRALVVTLALARVAALAGAYAWIRLRVPDRRLAALGAALFILSPHIASGLAFQRFFFAESAALLWLPLALLTVDAPWRSGTRLLVGAAVFAMLALTHIPEAVLVGIFAAGYALACHGPRRAAEIVGAGALGAVMAAIGLVPTFLLRGWITVAGLHQWYLSPAYTMLFSPRTLPSLRTLADQGVQLVLLVTWLAAACAAAALAWAHGGGQRLDRRGRGLLLTLVLVLLAMTWPAEPLWERLPLLDDVQFPWRCLEAASLLAAAAAVMAAQARPVLVWPLAAMMVLLAVGQAVVPLADQILSERWWAGERGRLPQFEPLSKDLSTERMATEAQAPDQDPPEYVPQRAYAAGWRADRDWQSAPGHWPTDRERQAKLLLEQAAHAALKAPAVLAGDAQVAITSLPASAPGSLLQLDADVSSPEGAVVRVPQFAWPALRAEGGGRLEPDPATGLSLLRLPPGHTATRLVLVGTGPETLGTALSAVGWLAWLAGVAWVAAARRRSARDAPAFGGPPVR